MGEGIHDAPESPKLIPFTFWTPRSRNLSRGANNYTGQGKDGGKFSKGYSAEEHALVLGRHLNTVAEGTRATSLTNLQLCVLSHR